MLLPFGPDMVQKFTIQGESHLLKHSLKNALTFVSRKGFSFLYKFLLFIDINYLINFTQKDMKKLELFILLLSLTFFCYPQELEEVLQLKQNYFQSDSVFLNENNLPFDTLVSVNEQESQLYLHIANSYYDQNNLEKAKTYYEIYLEHHFNDELALRVERIKYLLGEYLTSENYLLGYLEKFPQSSLKDYILLDLSKFYFKEKKYKKTINLLNKYISDDYKVLYYKAKSYEMLDEINKTLFIYHNILADTTKKSLNIRMTVFESYIEIIKKKKIDFAITDISILMEKLNSPTERTSLMETLAFLYESNSLYPEANDIYFTILSDTVEKNSTIYYKLINNFIQMHDYNGANEIADILIETDSTAIPNILFTKYYIANIQNESNLAKWYLLSLYHINESNNDKKTLFQLSNIYEKEEMFNVAYFLIKRIKNKSYEEIKKMEFLKTKFDEIDDFSIINFLKDQLKELDVFFEDSYRQQKIKNFQINGDVDA